MKNKDFFYLQYDKINWSNQEKTKINSLVNNYIINQIISKKKADTIKIFDIGFGIGFFLGMLRDILKEKYREMIIEGCEPSQKNYNYFKQNFLNTEDSVKIKTYNSSFAKTITEERFDFITAVYVFPHFIQDELDETVKKIYSMLEQDGKFILVVANEKYLAEKLQSMKDLFIEKNISEYNGTEYEEILHYSEIPEIGKLIDYNREEKFYLDLFQNNGFDVFSKIDLDDSGFICTVFIFQKK